MAKITKRIIDSLNVKSNDHFIWDDELKGFGLRVSPKGKKTFLVQYRAGGRTRRLKIGAYGALTADQARTKAKEHLGQIATGENPAELVSSLRKAPTVATVGERFITDHVDVRLKSTTARNYRTVINDVLKPALGSHKIVDIKRSDISALHHTYRNRPYQGNRILSVLRKLFNLCELWGLRPDGSNPCRLIPKYPEKKRERFLTPQELEQVWTALEVSVSNGTESIYVASAFKLLILTGCRLSEIQKLKWEWVKESVIALPDSKTGGRRVPLSQQAKEVISNLPRLEGNPFVIVGNVKSQHVTDLQKPWRRIRQMAKLPEVRIHDLRHTFASHAVMNGVPLAMVGKLIGHTQIQTTMRYAHLADDLVQETAADVASKLLAYATTKPPKPKGPDLRVVK